MQVAPVLMLNGICLQGGLFDGRQIQQLRTDSPVNNALPTAFIAWVGAAAAHVQQPVMHVPLYSDLQRRSTLPLQLDIPIADSSAKQQQLLAGLGACILV